MLTTAITAFKNVILLATLPFTLMLFIGYYEALEDAETRAVFFVKKYPTLQMKFLHIFANDADDKMLADLSEAERQAVINYCKYRLGMETRLETQADLDKCKPL